MVIELAASATSLDPGVDRGGSPPASIRHEVAQRVWVVLVAGIPTGVVVAGVGSRVAMLILRLTSPESVLGTTSDDGFEIGRVTFGGTYNLLMMGAAVGVIGAVAYRAVAPWLLGPTWLRRLTVGAASGAVIGSIVIHADGRDFRVLTPLWLAVGLFVALPAVFGVAISMAVDRMVIAGPPTGSRRWVVPALLVVAFPLVALVVVVATIVVVLGVVLRRVGRRREVPLVTGVVVRGAWLAAAVVGVAALVDDVRALT